MRWFKTTLVAILLLGSSTELFAEDPVRFRWKVALLAGDDQIAAFDNATKSLLGLLESMGVEPRNIRRLSANKSEQGRGVRASTAENVEAALRELAVGPGDACLLHLTSHGSRQAFFLRGAAAITPARLNTILDRGCGSHPTVVLVSACYSGIFIDGAMTKPNRIILTAAAEDRTSFGCSAENQYTHWDGCLIDRLAQADLWTNLFRDIQQCVELKEGGGRFTPSLPGAFFGDAVATMRIPGAADITAADGEPLASHRCAETKDKTYGLSSRNPVRIGFDAATGPARQIQYLGLLRGPEGQSVQYRRVETATVGGVILDVYELRYAGLAVPLRVYLDSYHFEEPAAIPGLVCVSGAGSSPR